MKRFTAQIVLAVALSAVLGGSVAHGRDQETLSYLDTIEKKAVFMETHSDPTNYLEQNALNRLYGIHHGIMVDLMKCPLWRTNEAESYCKMWWKIKMKKFYSFIYE